jgi:hypothetical protein
MNMKRSKAIEEKHSNKNATSVDLLKKGEKFFFYASLNGISSNSKMLIFMEVRNVDEKKMIILFQG